MTQEELKQRIEQEAEKQKKIEPIAAILRDNIHFSGQLGDYVIHGACEKILELLEERERKAFEAARKL